MSSLKQDMRQRFERRSSMSFLENNSGFDEGLLEQIFNLTYANLLPYVSTRWFIPAVKSPVLLQKLYKLTDEKRITESAFALIICFCSNPSPTDGLTVPLPAALDSRQPEWEGNSDRWRRDLDLLSLSIAYAAKYYCIESFILKSIDKEAIAREFALDRLKPVAAIIGLGHYQGNCVSPLPRSLYAETVRVL